MHKANFCFSGPPVEHVREVGLALRAIGDELDKDESLQQYGQNLFLLNLNCKVMVTQLCV